MKLSQIVAIEAGEKAQVTKANTEIYQSFEKPVLFNGQLRKFQPLMDDDTSKNLYPEENQVVQHRVEEIIPRAFAAWTKKLDVVYTKDHGNVTARADITLSNGKVLAKNVPATYLLWLQKELTDVQTFIKKLPTLDPSVRWTRDANDKLMKTDEVRTVKTKKMNRVIELQKPTDKHPGQSVVAQEDVPEGHWITVRISGAISQAEKQILEQRIHELMTAVKSALWAANGTEVEPQAIGRDLLNFVLNG